MRLNNFSKQEIVHEMNNEILKENLDAPSFKETDSSITLEKAFPILKGVTLHFNGCSFEKGLKVDSLSKEEKTKELYKVINI